LKPNQTPKTLVLSPHPDDESLACGGTLKLIADDGGHIDVLYMTSGDKGFFPNVESSTREREQLATIRQAEAREACRILGVQKVAFLPGQDGMLHMQQELADPILAALKAHKYRSIFCPWPLDRHSDHAATCSMLIKALERYSEEVEIWLYEVWTPMPANRFICIDASVEAKFEAFGAHKSQAALLNYADAFRGLARYRSLFCPPAIYAEAYYNCDSRTLLRNEDLPWSGMRLEHRPV
jgi:LmbE family N-acetylglucosaminyl deacetylase